MNATLDPVLEHSTEYFTPTPEVHLMRRVCAWCQADLGTVECERTQGGMVSHGICPSCFAKMKGEIKC